MASRLGADLWLTQIGLVQVALLGLEACLTWSLVKSEAGGGWRNRARALGLAEFSFRELGIALVVSALACLFMKYLWSPYLGMPGVAWLSELPFFELPDWHYQRSRPPELSAMATLMVVMLSTNVFCEEVFFRGSLFARAERFAGRHTWIVNGLLFIAYHVFQPAKTYAFFPTGLTLAGYYGWRRNLGVAMVLHLALNPMGTLSSALGAVDPLFLRTRNRTSAHEKCRAILPMPVGSERT